MMLQDVIKSMELTPYLDSGCVDLSLRLLPDANGVLLVSITFEDDGGTAFSGENRSDVQFRVQILPVNDRPSFSSSAGIYLNQSHANRTLRYDGFFTVAAPPVAPPRFRGTVTCKPITACRAQTPRPIALRSVASKEPNIQRLWWHTPTRSCSDHRPRPPVPPELKAAALRSSSPPGCMERARCRSQSKQLTAALPPYPPPGCSCSRYSHDLSLPGSRPPSATLLAVFA